MLLKSGLIRGVAFGDSGLTRGVAFGGSGFIIHKIGVERWPLVTVALKEGWPLVGVAL